MGGGGGGGGGGWAPPEPVHRPAPPTACRPPTHGPVTPPYELPAPAWLMVSPQYSGRQKPTVVSARGGLQTVWAAHSAPVCACNLFEIAQGEVVVHMPYSPQNTIRHNVTCHDEVMMSKRHAIIVAVHICKLNAYTDGCCPNSATCIMIMLPHVHAT